MKIRKKWKLIADYTFDMFTPWKEPKWRTLVKLSWTSERCLICCSPWDIEKHKTYIYIREYITTSENIIEHFRKLSYPRSEKERGARGVLSTVLVVGREGKGRVLPPPLPERTWKQRLWGISSPLTSPRKDLGPRKKPGTSGHGVQPPPSFSHSPFPSMEDGQSETLHSCATT